MCKTTIWLSLCQVKPIKPFPLGLLPFLIFSHTYIAWGQVSIASKPLLGEGDYSELMIDGIADYLDSLNSVFVAERDRFWEIDDSDETAYIASTAPNRQRLAKIIGAVDTPKPHPELEYISTTSSTAKVAENQY